MSNQQGLSDEQKQFLQGFAMGSDVARAVRGLPILSGSGSSCEAPVVAGSTVSPVVSTTSSPSETLQIAAQNRFLAEGKTLCKEEQAKREKDPFSLWNEIRANASEGVFPKGTDSFLYRYSGLFHVAPAQNSFMCRLRLPGGVLSSWQFRGVADLARRFGGGYVDVTTRANLQIREIGPHDAVSVLTGLTELGIINRGAGADNVRNITSSSTSGIDSQELIETLPLAKEMHHYILNQKDLYGLPRKFNIAFEGGGRIASLDDTNDIGFRAVRVGPDKAFEDLPAGVYFHLTLGGITGHKDFARETGVLLKPEECVPVAAAILRVFIRDGDRTDRKKARLKYLLDERGFSKFLELVEKEHGGPLRKAALDLCDAPIPDDRWAHVGFHRQKQQGFAYVGVVLPVGRLSVEQAEGLADVAQRYGSGTIRLTVWQNLLISDIAERHVDDVKLAIEELGLEWDASSFRSGLIACTGNAGCRFAASNTKSQALVLAKYLEDRLTLDRPINIHLTGCHHSCAQHYIGDIGLEATKVEVGEELVEGYHVCVGGGWGQEQGIARRLFDAVAFAEIPRLTERLIRSYLELRAGSEESFARFVRRHELEELRAFAMMPRSVDVDETLTKHSLQPA